MSQLCSILSKREEYVDFRPALHNKLFIKDDTFDMRFSAFLSLKAIVEKKKLECFGTTIKTVANYLCSERHIDSSFAVSRKLRCTTLTIGLSNADKEYLLDHSIRQCDSLETIEVVAVECSSSSGFDLLVEIANSFIQKYVVSSSKYSGKYKQLVDLASDFPLQTIDEIMSFTDDLTMTTTVVLKRCECIDSTSLSDLIHLLSESRYSGAHCRLHIVLVSSTLCSLPLPDDCTARSLMHITSHVIGGPQQIFDDLMTFVYNFSNIPIVFPKVLVESIHIAFQEFNLCVTSTVDRLILIFSLHFQWKRSILSVYKHLPIVSEMLKKSTASANSLRGLLSYLGADDVKNTDVVLSPSTQEKKFQSIEERIKVDQVLFAVFKYLRDKATRSKSITLAPSDLLWSAVSNGRQSHMGVCSRVLHDLIYAVHLYLPLLRFQQVLKILTEIRDMFNKLKVQLLQQYDEDRLAAMAAAAEAAAASAVSEPGKSTTNGGSSSSTATVVSESKPPEASVKEFVEGVKSDISSLLLIMDKFKSEFLEQECIAGVSRTDAVLLSLNGMKEKFVNDTSSLKMTRIDIKSSGTASKPDLVSVNCIDMYEGILADINTWLEGLIRSIRRLSPVRPVDGVFHLTEKSIATLQECTDDNLQTIFVTALEDPQKFFGGRKRLGINLDCQILYDKFKELRTGQVVANEWIPDLKMFGHPWDENSKDSGAVQVRKKSKSEGDTAGETKSKSAVENSSSSSSGVDGPVYSSTMRCRFAATMHDMEKSGMLKCRRTGKHGLVVISREMFAWMNDT